MIHLVTGGSGSGKSEYAENWLTGRNKKDGTYIYIATMQPYTEETMKKIERHLARKCKTKSILPILDIYFLKTRTKYSFKEPC